MPLILVTCVSERPTYRTRWARAVLRVWRRFDVPAVARRAAILPLTPMAVTGTLALIGLAPGIACGSSEPATTTSATPSSTPTPDRPTETSPTSPAVPQPATLAKQDLARQLDLDIGRVVVLRVRETVWPDKCLGVPAPELCAFGETPGYLVILGALDQQYEYHTDKNQSIRYAGPGDAPQRP